MKTYNSPMLQVVGINKNDIITGSDPNVKLGDTPYDGPTDGSGFCAPDRFNIWYEGY